VTALGHAKRTPIDEYPAQKRGGLGTITLQVTDRTGPLVAAQEMLEGDEFMVICRSGKTVRIGAADVPVQGRNTQGRALVGLAKGDAIARVARVAGREEEEEAPARVEPRETTPAIAAAGTGEAPEAVTRGPRPEVAAAQLELDAT
jgi:DNA gyrase subunit A